MKFRIGAAIALIVCLACAICVGAYRGWSEERSQVEQLSSGLEQMLGSRVESAYNLLTVAQRHLPRNDARMQAVTEDREVLESNADFAQKAAANARLTRDGEALLSALLELDSVQQDDRDQMYVTAYLPQMLEESEEKTASANYNLAAAAFNARLRESFSGRLAQLLGVEPAQEFAAE